VDGRRQSRTRGRHPSPEVPILPEVLRIKTNTGVARSSVLN
jgi:hypothetical protein